MFDYGKLIEALKLPTKVMVGVATATGVLLLVDGQSTSIDFDAFGSSLVRPFVIIIFIISAALSVVGIADYALAPLRDRQRHSLLASRRALRRQENEERASAAKARALAHLDYLSEQELHYVADCLQRNSPTFYTWVHSSGASILQGKGLVWNPGDPHHQDNYPFCFYDFAWDAILARKDEFVAKDKEFKEANKGKR